MAGKDQTRIDNADLVQWIDLPATFLDASACAPDPRGQGHSLIPLATGKDVDWRSWAFCEYRYSGFATDPLIMTTMIRHENWKLIVWPGSPACGNTRDGELYDLNGDPGELNNLYHDASHAQQRRFMKGLLLDAMSVAEDHTEPQTRPW